MAWQAARGGAAGLGAGLGRAALALLYPPQCLACDTPVTEDFAFCPACWRETRFITGLTCDACGTPLPGEETGQPVQCDDCIATARPWMQGRAALVYGGPARALILQLKHGDRLDLAVPAGRWLLRAAAPLIRPATVVAPVPLHWWRLIRRRYNQAALLSAAVARGCGRTHIPDLLRRPRATPPQDHRGREARFANLSGAIAIRPRRAGAIAGRPVLLIDDVMTSGATLAAATEACLAAGAARVDVAVLARVARMA